VEVLPDINARDSKTEVAENAQQEPHAAWF